MDQVVVQMQGAFKRRVESPHPGMLGDDNANPGAKL